MTAPFFNPLKDNNMATSPTGVLTPPRCGALKRNGQLCMGSAMKNGRCRCHGGKAGAPLGNQNNYRHGFYVNALSPDEQAEWPAALGMGSGASALEADLALMRVKLKRLLRAANDDTLADKIEHSVDIMMRVGTDPEGLPFDKKSLKTSIPRIGELIVQAVDQIRKLSLSVAQLKAAEKALIADQEQNDTEVNVNITVVSGAPLISTEE